MSDRPGEAAKEILHPIANKRDRKRPEKIIREAYAPLEAENKRMRDALEKLKRDGIMPAQKNNYVGWSLSEWMEYLDSINTMVKEIARKALEETR